MKILVACEVSGKVRDAFIKRGHEALSCDTLPTDIVDGRENRVHRMAPTADRAKKRSKTYQGIADAMAEQWVI